jgi:hypothetical protein
MLVANQIIYPELAPCGVFRGACPSMNKTCLGCVSLKKNQIRSSEWACKMRLCCYRNKDLASCI